MKIKYAVIYFIIIISLFFHQQLNAQVLLNADGKTPTYELIDSVLGDKSICVEAPDQCESHPQFGRHILDVYDSILQQHVFEFKIHVKEDNDRCVFFDRQRVEIKTFDQSPDNLKGTENETIKYNWNFKLPEGFQPSPNFTHIHQIKAVGGDASMPLFTITPRFAKEINKLEILYYKDSTSNSIVLESANLNDFINQWIEATEVIKVGKSGTYSLVLKNKISGKVLLTYHNSKIQTIRKSNHFIRPKWGLYRSLCRAEFLRDESLRLANISIEEIKP